jgi:NTE family protein
MVHRGGLMALADSLRSFGDARNLRGRWRQPVQDIDVPAGRPDHGSQARRATARQAGDRPGQAGGIAFVLQGGGSLAAPQVGMLRALREAGLTPDLVIGSSAGAINAVAFASDPGPAGLDRLEAVWMSLRRRHVAPLSARTLAAAVAGRGDGLVPSSALRGLLASAAIAGTLDGTSIPAHVVATDLASGTAVVLSDGETARALLASCAFPGLYPPVRVGGRLLVDGGVSADVPVLQAEALGATVTYVLPAAVCDVAQSLPRGPLPLAYHALGQILGAAARGDLAAARGPVHVLPAPSSRAASPVDFRDTSRLIDEGYRLAADWLASHMMPAGTGTRTGLAPAGLLTNQAGASAAAAMSTPALYPHGVHASTADRPSGSCLQRAVSAFLAVMPGSEVVTAWLRPGPAR